jgi:hypothetical protein
MTRPTPRPRRRADDDAESAEATPALVCSLGDGLPVHYRGLCAGHWASRRGDADPKD